MSYFPAGGHRGRLTENSLYMYFFVHICQDWFRVDTENWELLSHRVTDMGVLAIPFLLLVLDTLECGSTLPSWSAWPCCFLCILFLLSFWRLGGQEDRLLGDLQAKYTWIQGCPTYYGSGPSMAFLPSVCCGVMCCICLATLALKLTCLSRGQCHPPPGQ